MKQLLLILVALLSLAGCNTNDPSTQGNSSNDTTSTTISLSVSPQKISHSGSVSSIKYINVECNTHWEIKIVNEDMFYLVTPKYGKGDNQITVFLPEISYYERNSFVNQYGSITVSCKNENGRLISKKVECTRTK